MTEATDAQLCWYPHQPKTKRPSPATFSDEDIELWLKHNAPLTFEQLSDIRYSLYHCCTRSEFVVVKAGGAEFDLTGRCSKLRVTSNQARHYLLWKLRLL